jgi:hypothetical protein
VKSAEWWVGQLMVSAILAWLIARMAERKGRSGAAAAILLLTFVHGWPAITWAAGTALGSWFHLNDTARRVLAGVFWATGILWGSLWSFAIVACWNARRLPDR